MKDLPLAAGEKWPVAWVRCDLREQNEQQKAALRSAQSPASPDLARDLVSSPSARRADLGSQSSSCIRTSTSALSSPRGAQITCFRRTAAEGTRFSLRWAAEVLEELQNEGLLILEGLESGAFSRFSWAEMGGSPRIEWY